MNGSRKLRGKVQAEGQARGEERGRKRRQTLCALWERPSRSVSSSGGMFCDAAPLILSLLRVICQEILMGSFTDSRKAALMAKVIRLC